MVKLDVVVSSLAPIRGNSHMLLGMRRMKVQTAERVIGGAYPKTFRTETRSLRLYKENPANGNGVPATADGAFTFPPLGFPANRRKKRMNGHEAIDPRKVATLYEKATGESPHEVVAAGRAVIVETGVAGSYEDFPNGYVPILISRTSDGYAVSDTGQTAPRQGFAAGDVMRDGDILYVETGNQPESLQNGIRILVSALRYLNEGW